jgi:hypothetical protein
MASTDDAPLEVDVGKGEPSRLLIEIALRPESLALPSPTGDAAEVRRAIRDGFHDLLMQVEIERLARQASPPRSSTRRWIGRAVGFVISASIGSAVTGLLATAQAPRPYAVGSLTPPSIESAPPGEVARPDSQSAGAPSARAAPSSGPARFGLREE